jgi:hypothetical protein
MKFYTFPREMGLPRTIAYNLKEYLRFINLNNGKRGAVYTTIYHYNAIDESTRFTKPIYETAVIDKMFFDIDNKDCNPYDEAKKLHNYCKKENLKHSIVMSGRGYHVYIYVKTEEITYKKTTLKSAQLDIINKIGLICDHQVIGDICRLTRVPNTYNMKGKRFCIPLNERQFLTGDDNIKKHAVKQNFIKDIFIGEKLFDLKQFDIKPEETFNLDLPTTNNKVFFSIGVIKSSRETKLGKLPICIQSILNNPESNYKNRYLAILYFKEKGYTREEVLKILQDFLTPKKFNHCIYEEKQLQYLFNRDDLIFPTCEKINNDGQCPGKCEFYGECVYR